MHTHSHTCMYAHTEFRMNFIDTTHHGRGARCCIRSSARPRSLRYSYDLYSYGLHSYVLSSYGLHSYGLYSQVLYSHGLYNYGKAEVVKVHDPMLSRMHPFAHVHAHVHTLHTCACTRTVAHPRTCTHACTHVCMHTGMHAHTHARRWTMMANTASRSCCGSLDRCEIFASR